MVSGFVMLQFCRSCVRLHLVEVGGSSFPSLASNLKGRRSTFGSVFDFRPLPLPLLSLSQTDNSSTFKLLRRRPTSYDPSHACKFTSTPKLQTSRTYTCVDFSDSTLR